MIRILKILSVAAIIFVLYMWGSIMFKSCNKQDDFNFKHTDTNTNPKDTSIYAEDNFFDEGESVDTSQSDPSINYDDIDKKVEEVKNIQQTPTPSEQKEAVASKKQENKVETPAVTTEKKSTANTTNSKSASTITQSKNGSYMVICGSYSIEANADSMVKKLKKMGYTGAEKVVFDLSDFHSVISGRYTDQSKAAQASAELKSNGIESYVKKVTK